MISLTKGIEIKCVSKRIPNKIFDFPGIKIKLKKSSVANLLINRNITSLYSFFCNDFKA